jgi:hypothetical protein
MTKPILSSRSRIPAAKTDALLKCYAARLSPSETAEQVGLSLNTVYEQYARIRWRLIEVGYYQDAALSKTESGLSESVQEQLRLRRGLEDDDIYAHAAEVIEWAEEWPPVLVLRHLRKVIELTGPIDVPLELSADQASIVITYVRYARTQLIFDRIAESAKADPAQESFLQRVAIAMDTYRKDYRAAVKRTSRQSKATKD